MILFSSDPAAPDLAALARDLTHPPLRLDVEELAALWSYDVIRAVCPRPPGLEDYPELSVRLRGAFGRALHGLDGRTTATGRPIARAVDVLFTPLAEAAPGLELPRPAIVRADVSEGQLVVDVHVFGDAMAWTRDAALALLLALRGGVALSSSSRIRVAVEPDDVLVRRVTGVTWPEGPRWAALRLRSPASVRHGGRMIDDPAALARACIRRVSSMARWQGVEVVPDGDALQGVEADGRDLVAYGWSRHTRRAPGTTIPMRGQLGRLVLTGPLSRLAPWLALAATCNTGSHAGLGLGWFELDMA